MNNKLITPMDSDLTLLICTDLQKTQRNKTIVKTNSTMKTNSTNCDKDPSTNDQAMRGAVPVHPEPAKSPSHPSPGVKFAASQASSISRALNDSKGFVNKM